MNYKFWKRIAEYSTKKMEEAYLKPNGGCDSCCPRCKKWESHGNVIITKPLIDGSDKRECQNCGNIWLAIFTPAGFIPIEEINKPRT